MKYSNCNIGTYSMGFLVPLVYFPIWSLYQWFVSTVSNLRQTTLWRGTNLAWNIWTLQPANYAKPQNSVWKCARSKSEYAYVFPVPVHMTWVQATPDETRCHSFCRQPMDCEQLVMTDFTGASFKCVCGRVGGDISSVSESHLVVMFTVIPRLRQSLIVKLRPKKQLL